MCVCISISISISISVSLSLSLSIRIYIYIYIQTYIYNSFCTYHYLYILDLCVSSLRRAMLDASLLCIVPILTDDPRRESILSCYVM